MGVPDRNTFKVLLSRRCVISILLVSRLPEIWYPRVSSDPVLLAEVLLHSAVDLGELDATSNGFSSFVRLQGGGGCFVLGCEATNDRQGQEGDEHEVQGRKLSLRFVLTSCSVHTEI